MVNENPINVTELNKLKDTLSKLLLHCRKLLKNEKRGDKWVSVEGTYVIVLRNDNRTLRTTYRKAKFAGEIEVTVISYVDAMEGPTEKRFYIYLGRLARFMERRGLYQHRPTITTDTPEMFQEIEK